MKKVYKTRGGSTPITIDKVNTPSAMTSQKDAFRDGFYVAKYDLTKYVDPSRHVSDGNYSNANWYILRYADVLLMYAESLNELYGPTQDAYDAVNMVRRRAYGLYKAAEKVQTPEKEENVESEGSTDVENSEDVDPDGGVEGGIDGDVAEDGEVVPEEPEVITTVADLPTGMSQEEFRQAIRQERAYELCFEGNRKQDLIRWGIYAESIVQTGRALNKWNPECPTDYYLSEKYTVKGKHELQPIPQRELDLMPEFEQNPNWGK